MFLKAERKRAKLKIGISGPSGSGKTYSALKLAKGMGGKVAVIDTENDSASLYGDEFVFDSCNISPPYTTQKYLDAMKNAEDAGYDIVIIDSATHQWDGDGGILKRKEQVDARGGNSFTNWSQFTPEHERFKAALVNSKTHLICTLRSKQDYIMGENSKGKAAPKKVGLAPIQREGFEYEMTVMFDMAMDHSAIASKDRTSLFDSKIFTPKEEAGQDLIKWLNGGKVEAPAPDPVPNKLTEEKKSLLVQIAKFNGHTQAEVALFVKNLGKSFLELTEEEYKLTREHFLKPKQPIAPVDADWEKEAALTADPRMVK